MSLVSHIVFIKELIVWSHRNDKPTDSQWLSDRDVQGVCIRLDGIASELTGPIPKVSFRRGGHQDEGDALPSAVISDTVGSGMSVGIFGDFDGLAPINRLYCHVINVFHHKM